MIINVIIVLGIFLLAVGASFLLFRFMFKDYNNQ